MLTKFKKDIDGDLNRFLNASQDKLKIRATSRLLYDGIQDFLRRGGKRIRPILFLLAYQGYTGRKNYSYKKLIHCSLSLELLHDFLLVHDDVIDNSALRRGKPTLHRFFNSRLKKPADNELGPSLSIVAGDIMFSLAIETFLSFDEDPARKEKALLEFIKSAAYTGMGEFIDVMNNIKSIKDIKRKDVFLTYTLKTAKYTFEGPLIIGAILGGAEKNEIKKLSRLGIVLGQAFQIQDDLLDIFSTSKKIGKPILSDLVESKKTLPLLETYKNLSAKDKKTLHHLLEKDKKTYKDLLQFRKMIKKSGAGASCLKNAYSLLEKADSICGGLNMKAKYKNVLQDFINDLLSEAKALKI